MTAGTDSDHTSVRGMLPFLTVALSALSQRQTLQPCFYFRDPKLNLFHLRRKVSSYQGQHVHLPLLSQPLTGTVVKWCSFLSSLMFWTMSVTKSHHVSLPNKRQSKNSLPVFSLVSHGSKRRPAAASDTIPPTSCLLSIQMPVCAKRSAHFKFNEIIEAQWNVSPPLPPRCPHWRLDLAFKHSFLARSLCSLTPL